MIIVLLVLMLFFICFLLFLLVMVVICFKVPKSLFFNSFNLVLYFIFAFLSTGCQSEVCALPQNPSKPLSLIDLNQRRVV